MRRTVTNLPYNICVAYVDCLLKEAGRSGKSYGHGGFRGYGGYGAGYGRLALGTSPGHGGHVVKGTGAGCLK